MSGVPDLWQRVDGGRDLWDAAGAAGVILRSEAFVPADPNEFTIVGTAFANAATITIPAHQAGDIIIIFAWRSDSVTPPSAGAGFATLISGGNNGNSNRIGWLEATGSGTTSGTWTNATRLACVVVRNATIDESAADQAGGATDDFYWGSVTFAAGRRVLLFGENNATYVGLAAAIPPTSYANIARAPDQGSAIHLSNGLVPGPVDAFVSLTGGGTPRYRTGLVPLIPAAASGTTYDRTAAVAAASVVAANRGFIRAGIAGVAATSVVSATGQKAQNRAAGVAAASTVTVAGTIIRGRAAGVASAATVTVNRGVTRPRAAGVASAAVVTVNRSISTPRAAGVAALSAVTVNRTRIQPRSAGVAAVSTVTAVGGISGGSSSAVVATSTVSATATVIRNRAAGVASAAAVTVARTVIRPRAAAVAAVSVISVGRTITRGRQAAVAALAAVVVDRTITRNRASGVAALSTAVVARTVIRPRTAGVSAAAIVTALGKVLLPRSAAVAAVSAVTATGGVRKNRAAAVAAVSTVTANGFASSDIERETQVLATSTVAAARTHFQQASAAVAAVGAPRVGVGVFRFVSVLAGASVEVIVGTGTQRSASVAASSLVTVARNFVRVRSVLVAARSAVRFFINRTAAVAAGSVVSASGIRGRFRVAEVSSSARVTARWTLTTNGTVSFKEVPALTGSVSPGQTLSARALVRYEASAAVAAVSNVQAGKQGTVYPRSVGVAATSRATARWRATTNGEVSFKANPAIYGAAAEGQTLRADAAVTYQATARVEGRSTVIATSGASSPIIQRGVGVFATSIATARARGTFTRAVSVIAAPVVTANGTRGRQTAVSIVGVSNVQAVSGGGVRLRSANINAASSVSVAGFIGDIGRGRIEFPADSANGGTVEPSARGGTILNARRRGASRRV